jgi:hypothetical protein
MAETIMAAMAAVMTTAEAMITVAAEPAAAAAPVAPIMTAHAMLCEKAASCR